MSQGLIFMSMVNKMRKIVRKHYGKHTQKRIFKVFAILIAIIILAISIDVNWLWVGDYRILIPFDFKTVHLDDYRGDESMEIPSHIGPFTVNHVNFSIFRENENITSIYIPSDFDPEVLIGIEDCVNLKKIEFEEGITVLNMQVFNCDNLEEVIIPEGVVELRGCFNRCSSLGDVKLPSTLKIAKCYDFEDTLFYELHKEDKYYVVGDGVLLFFNGDKNGDIVIPSGVKYYNGSLYTDDEETLRKIYIPDTMKALDVWIYDGDTYYFGAEEFESLELNDLNSGPKGTIVAPANSYMEQYCKENGYNFRVMTEEEEAEWREKTEAATSEITYQE